MSKIALLVGDGFEDSEFEQPYQCLRAAGHETMIIGSQHGAVMHGKRGDSEVEVEHSANEVESGDFDAIVIPGGHGPDRLRMDDDLVAFTRTFADSGKPVAAICHGPQLLIEADVVRGHRMTSWPSVRTDLINAGAHWVDEPVVEDANLITSRKPDDLDAFCETLLRRL